MPELRSLKPEKIKCEAKLFSSMHHLAEQCPNNAAFQFMGKHYCRPHTKQACFDYHFKESNQ